MKPGAIDGYLEQLADELARMGLHRRRRARILAEVQVHLIDTGRAGMPHLWRAPAEARLENCIAIPGEDGNEYAAAHGGREPAVGVRPVPERSGKSFLSRLPNECGRSEHDCPAL